MTGTPAVTRLRLVMTAPDYEQALAFYRDVLVRPGAPHMSLPAGGLQLPLFSDLSAKPGNREGTAGPAAAATHTREQP